MFIGVLAIPKSVDIQKQLTDSHVKEWLQNDVFHFKWWLLIVIIMLLFVVWWIMLDKSRVREICLFAVLSIILYMGINEYGEELTLWDYPIDIIPIFPPLSSVNLISVPLVYSLVYQHFSKRKNFIFAAIIASAVICFLYEPLLSWGGYYRLIHWQYFFSFPIYVVVAISIRAIIIKINIITNKNKVRLSQNDR